MLVNCLHKAEKKFKKYISTFLRSWEDSLEDMTEKKHFVQCVWVIFSCHEHLINTSENCVNFKEKYIWNF